MGGCCSRFRPSSRTDIPVSDVESPPVHQDDNVLPQPLPVASATPVTEVTEHSTVPSYPEQHASHVAGQQTHQISPLKRRRDDPLVVTTGSMAVAGSRWVSPHHPLKLQLQIYFLASPCLASPSHSPSLPIVAYSASEPTPVVTPSPGSTAATLFVVCDNEASGKVPKGNIHYEGTTLRGERLALHTRVHHPPSMKTHPSM